MMEVVEETNLTGGFFLRRMQESDLEEVLEIEEASFPTPWTKHAFMREMLLPLSHFWVVLYRTEVIGYIGYWYIEGEVQILNLAVKDEFRKKGIAKQMLMYILDVVYNNGAKSIYLEVRRSNLVAQKLYKSLGFEVSGYRSNYYEHESEDAILMKK
ncbi:MAG: ribosomal protein S18-alanine N-acetyltransferase [bacterium]